MNKLKIIFIGIPDLAYVCLDKLLQKKFDIVGVVPPRKTQVTSHQFKEYVKEKGLNLIEFEKTPNEQGCIEKIKKLNADIGVVCAYDVLFNKDFLNTTKMGYLNCHPSLLPQYRGAMPYFHIIKDGCKTSGVTIHFMDEKFDCGDIVFQKQFELNPFETMGTLFNRTNFMLSEGLVEVLESVQKGNNIKRIPQNTDIAYKTAPNVSGNFRIKWNKKAIQIQNLIRAANPFYNVYAKYRGIIVKIIKADAIEYKHNFKPGKIVEASEKEILIAALDGYLSIKIIQVSSWGIFDNFDFYYTFSPNTDEYFE